MFLVQKEANTRRSIPPPLHVAILLLSVITSALTRLPYWSKTAGMLDAPSPLLPPTVFGNIEENT